MFHKIDFTQLGGFPLTQNTMAFIQESYNNVLEAVSFIAGQYIILSGLTQTSPNVYSDGWVTYNGEIIPFDGGTGQSNVSIVETAQTNTFRNGNVFPVLFNKKVIFNASGSIPFSNFSRLSLESLNTLINSVNNVANNALSVANNATTVANNALSVANNAVLPAGIITMWSGAILNIPTGWALCDGSPGTPNLSGKFILSYSGGTYGMNTTGGIASNTLGITNIPAHSHNYSDSYYIEKNIGGSGLVPGTQIENFGGNNYKGSAATDGDNNNILYRNRSTLNTGLANPTPIDNRPPYYVLAYIIKLP